MPNISEKNSQEYRDNLAKEIKNTPKEERKTLLESQRNTLEYQKARLINLIGKIEINTIDTNSISPEKSLQHQENKLRLKKVLSSKNLFNNLSDSQIAEIFIDCNKPEMLEFALNNDFLNNLNLDFARKLIKKGFIGGLEFYAKKFDKESYSDIIEELINTDNCNFLTPFLVEDVGLNKEKLAERIFQIDGIQVLSNIEFFDKVDPTDYITRLIDEGKIENLSLFLHLVKNEEKLQEIIKLIIDKDTSEETINNIISKHSNAINEEILHYILAKSENINFNQVYMQIFQEQKMSKILSNPILLEHVLNNSDENLIITALESQEVDLDLVEKFIISNPEILKFIPENYLDNLKINNEIFVSLLEKSSNTDLLAILTKLDETNFTEKFSNEIIDLLLKNENIYIEVILDKDFILKQVNLKYLIEKIVEKGQNFSINSLILCLLRNPEDLKNIELTNEELDFFKKNNILKLNELHSFPKLFYHYSSIELEEIFRNRRTKESELTDIKVVLENINLFPNIDLNEIYNLIYVKAPELIIENLNTFKDFEIDLEEICSKLIAQEKIETLLKNLTLFPNLKVTRILDLLINTNKSKYFQEYFHLFSMEERIKELDKLLSMRDYNRIIDNFLLFQDIERENLIADLLSKSQKPLSEKLKILINKKEIFEVTKHLENQGYGLVLYLSLKDDIDKLPQEVRDLILKYRHFESETVQIDGEDYEVYNSNPYKDHPWNPDKIDLNTLDLVSGVIEGSYNLENITNSNDSLKKLIPLLEKLKLTVDQQFEDFIKKGLESNFISPQEKALIFTKDSKELKNLKSSLIKNLSVYLIQSAEGNLDRITEMLENPDRYLTKLQKNLVQVLHNEANLIPEINQSLINATGDRRHQIEHLVTMCKSIPSLIEVGLEKYLKAYEIDIPLYDIVYNEFDGYRESGNYFQEVFLGRDGIYAKLGRRALITSMLRKMGREERIKFKQNVEQHRLNPSYLIYPRFFVQNMKSKTLKKYLEQNNISLESNPLFFDTGFTGSIPINIGEVLKFGSQEIEQRIRLLSADKASRRIRGIQENARNDIVNFIEENSKVEGAAEGIYYDRDSGKLQHISKPLYPEQQFFYSIIKQAIERHYWLRGRLESSKE